MIKNLLELESQLENELLHQRLTKEEIEEHLKKKGILFNAVNEEFSLQKTFNDSTRDDSFLSTFLDADNQMAFIEIYYLETNEEDKFFITEISISED